MNLYDLVLRRDRALAISGDVAAIVAPTLAGKQRAVRFGADASLRVRNAHEMTGAARVLPFPGWRVLAGDLSFAVEENADGYDIVCRAWSEADLGVGPLFDARAPLRRHLVGKGVEVGPGLRPILTPSGTIDVEYVEAKQPADWIDTYARGSETQLPAEDVLARYRIGSAETLDQWDERSLDFIFSNHVFEHLMNPAQVLRNWAQRLRPRGVIAGVLPDARYCFDCRQPFSTLEDFRDEYERGGFSPPDAKYEQWVRYTSPRATVKDLKARGYSIHMHYYTPEVFRELMSKALPHARLQIFTAANNKDFGFLAAVNKPWFARLRRFSGWTRVPSFAPPRMPGSAPAFPPAGRNP